MARSQVRLFILMRSCSASLTSETAANPRLARGKPVCGRGPREGRSPMTQPIPLLDGETLHLVPLNSCMFGRKDDAKLALDGLNLMP